MELIDREEEKAPPESEPPGDPGLRSDGGLPESESPSDPGLRRDGPEHEPPSDLGLRRDGPEHEPPSDLGLRRDGPEPEPPSDPGLRRDGTEPEPPSDLGLRRDGTEPEPPSDLGLLRHGKEPEPPSGPGLRRDGPEPEPPSDPGLRRDGTEPEPPSDLGLLRDGSEPEPPIGPGLRRDGTEPEPPSDPAPPRAIDDGEITRMCVTLERSASESYVNTERRRPWSLERDQHARRVRRRANSAGPVEARLDTAQTYDDTPRTRDDHTGSLLVDADDSQDSNSVSVSQQDLGDDGAYAVRDGRITSRIRTYVDGLIAHVIGTFSGGLRVERKPLLLPSESGHQPGGPWTEPAEEQPCDPLISPDDSGSTHGGTFDRETLDIAESNLGSVSTQGIPVSTDVFNKGTGGEGSSANEPTPSVAVETGVGLLTDNGSTPIDDRRLYTATGDRADSVDPYIPPRLRAIPQPDLIISRSIAAAAGGGCDGGGSAGEGLHSDSDNVRQPRRQRNNADTEDCTDDDNDDDDDDDDCADDNDNDGHAALVIAEEEWRRCFYKELRWREHYPGNRSSSNSSSSSDKPAAARVRSGRRDAAYRSQTSPADPGGGDGGDWSPGRADSVAAAETAALSDDVFLASGGHATSSLTAGEDNPDNYLLDNNYTDTYDAVIAVAAHADTTGYSREAESPDAVPSESVDEAGVSDNREGRFDRPESQASEGEAPGICFESICPLDSDQQEQGEEVASDDCVTRVASDVDSTPPSPEVFNWHRASGGEAKIVHTPSDFVQSPDCIDVPQVLYRSYR